MQVRCSACSTTFVVGDDIVRVVRKRGGTVPCRSCKAPIAIPGDGPTTPEPAQAKPVEPAKPKPVVEAPKPAPAVSVAPRVPTATKPAVSVAPRVPTAPKAAAPPVPAQRPVAAALHTPPPLPSPRASDKTRSLPPPVRSVAPKPPVPIAVDEWLETEPEEVRSAPSPATPPPSAITLSASEFPPAAIVTVSTSAAPPPLPAPAPVAKAAPPPLPEMPAPTPAVTAATSDVPPAPLVPNIALAPTVALVDDDASAERPRTKRRIAVAFATALLAGIGLVAVIHPRSRGSAEAVASKDIAPRPRASVAIPSPPASVEAPSPTASAEAPTASGEAPSPAASAEAPSPKAAEKNAPSPVETPPAAAIETPPTAAVAAQKPTGGSVAAAPRGAPAGAERPPETDLSSLQPSKPAKVDSRADDGALQEALAQAAERAKGCRDATGPSGVARVSVTIAPSGDVTGAVVQGPPFAHTLEGDCVAAKFRAVHVPPFSGDSINVRKSVSLQ